MSSFLAAILATPAQPARLGTTPPRKNLSTALLAKPLIAIQDQYTRYRYTLSRYAPHEPFLTLARGKFMTGPGIVFEAKTKESGKSGLQLPASSSITAWRGLPGSGFAALRRDRLRSKLRNGQAGLPGRSSKQSFERSLVSRAGLDSAGGSDLWFKAHPKEEPMNHSLATVQRGARRAPATSDHRIKSPQPATLKSLIFSKLQCA